MTPKINPTTGSNAIQRLTLQFREPALEQEFNQNNSSYRITQLRWVSLLVAVLYGAFMVFDPVLAPDVYQTLWMIHLAMIGYFIAMFLLSHSDWGLHHLHVFSFVSLNLCTFTMVAKLVMVPAGVTHIYYMGFLLVAISAFGFSGNSFVQGFISLGVILVTFNGSMLYLNSLSGTVLIAYDFFLVATCIISATTGYLLEKQQRLLFYQVFTFHEEKNLHEHRARHDGLTGLPNRQELEVRVELALEAAKKESTKLAIAFLDIDNFKPINDQYGHPVGDLVLKIVAERLQRGVRSSDTVARYGGDEFLIILEDLRNDEDVKQVLNSIHKRMSKPIYLEVDQEVMSFTLSISTGVAVYPDHGSSPNQLIEYADQAMYEEKTADRQTAITP